MNYKPIVIVAGEPNSVFLEIFFKSLKKNKFLSPLILICSHKLLILQMKKLKFKKNIRLINLNNLNNLKLNNKSINLIDVKLNQIKAFGKINKDSKNYIKNSFKLGFQIIKLGITNKFINGPISKKSFLDKKFLGMTEYIAKNFKSKKIAMLIYNQNLSVCPITTHLPISLVSKKINKLKIIEKARLVNDFYKKYLKFRPNIAVLGLNPHCESIKNFNEDEKIVKPAVKYLKKMKFKISGPYPADTIFLKSNRDKFDVIIGMYHDQILGPLKTIYEHDAINITLGLSFLRISPDHGPNEAMLGKNLSNPISLIKAIKFLDKN